MTKRKYLSEMNAEAVRLTCEDLQVTEDDLFDAIMSDEGRTGLKRYFFRRIKSCKFSNNSFPAAENIIPFLKKKGV